MIRLRHICMRWSIGFDSNWGRDIGYGVPSNCDHPKCNNDIDRGLGYVCGSDPRGGEYGCGLYFCGQHLFYHQPRGSDRPLQLCPRCVRRRTPYKNPKPDTKKWIEWKLVDESWAKWREENPEFVEQSRKDVDIPS